MKRLLLIAFFLAVGLPIFGQQWPPPSTGGGGTGTMTVCATPPVTNKIIYWSGPTEGCGINSPTIDPATGDVTFVRNVSITSTLSVGTTGTGMLDLKVGTVGASPASGLMSLFFDSANSNHLSSVTSGGSVVDIQAGGGGPFEVDGTLNGNYIAYGAKNSSTGTSAETVYRLQNSVDTGFLFYTGSAFSVLPTIPASSFGLYNASATGHIIFGTNNITRGGFDQAGLFYVRNDTTITGVNDLAKLSVAAYSDASVADIVWSQTSGSLNMARFGLKYTNATSQASFVWRDMYNSGAGSTEIMSLTAAGLLSTTTFQPSTSYKSVDGTVGATVTTCTAFKNGLCVSGS